MRSVAGPRHVKETALSRVILRIQHQDVDRYPSRKMEGIRSFLSFHAVSDDVPVLILRRWQALDLPVWGQIDGHIVHFLKRKFKIDGVSAVRVPEDMVVRCAATPTRNHST